MLKIRDVTLEDAHKLVEIYAPYVLNTDVTFEYDVPSVEEFKQRIINITKKYPYYVIENNDVIVGYAYASDYRSRKAYQYVCELSIYIDQNYHGKQVGTMLYNQLLETLKSLNYQKVYACITYPNDKSIAFHNKFGFEQIAYFKECGYKQNQWLDMIFMEKRINEKENLKDIKLYK